MDEYYLILYFQNARLFRKYNKDKVNWKCSDFVFNSATGSYKSRDYIPSFIEPITVHQISNMLHVLFNERPVPSFRQTLYGRNNYYFEKAQNSYIKIDTPKINKDNFYYETVQVRKAVHNSWNTNITANWEIVRRYVDDESKLNILINKFNELLNIDSKSIPFVTVRKLVLNLSIEKRLDLYKTITELGSITGLVDYFGVYKANGTFNKPDDSKITCKWNKTARLVNIGLERAICLSGQIIVPVSEADVLKLKTSSKGCATILDGGLIWIDSIKNGNNVSIEGFTCVKDISDERTKPAIKATI